jgi:DNA-binding protein
MDNSIKDIIGTLSTKYNLSKVDIERIIDSEFRVLANTVEAGEVKIVNMVYIGKFRPTYYLPIANEARRLKALKLQEDETNSK